MSSPRGLRIATVLLPVAVLAAAAIGACTDSSGDPKVCEPGETTCRGDTALRCTDDGTGLVVVKDCTVDNQVCTKNGCKTCQPDATQCFGEKLLKCNGDGSGYLAEPLFTCDLKKGEVCDSGGCTNACELARKNKSYVGCEYWAVDLDNAVVQIGAAAAQQFAVVVSNPSPLTAEVTVTQNDAKPGETPIITEVTKRTVAPNALEVILLPAREVDGSPPGEFDTGTGTAWTANAYKLSSSVPLIAYQFNPLSNAGVFSNDASLLLPVSAVSLDSAGTQGAPYLVMGWPQTIATTSDPSTNFGSDLRAFLTIVGTREETEVKIKLSTAIIGDNDKIKAANKGETLSFTIGPYEVLNLETGGFGRDADFTGTRVESSKPVIVFSGSEASDVPDPPDLTVRRCCADHIEQQLYPTTTLGRTFIALKTPSRTKALKAAGAQVEPKEEMEYFRILAAGEFTAVTTNLPEQYENFTIGAGEFVRLDVKQDFTIQATDAIIVGQFVAGQQEVGIPSTLPGGDPSFILLPPVEQFRTDYLFLTPDKYAFDFILVAAPKDATVRLDNRLLGNGCDSGQGKKLCCEKSTVGKVLLAGDKIETEFVAYKCQLSFPEVDETLIPPRNLAPGSQNDGVHRLRANRPIGLVVYGFDAYVSYGYPGGTDLEIINIK
ncbi:MAG: IgGFc-binding protein [Myxococcales bacterium]|nr:IgGFc-binding protein [Myxococcales bacterium]